MSENALLKDSFGPEVARLIAASILKVHPSFPRDRFIKGVSTGFEDLELMGRAAHIATALRETLPKEFDEAARILLKSLSGSSLVGKGGGMASFRYLPYCIFVSRHGLSDFELSMKLQYELTQLFTAEFSIRSFIIHDQKRTLARLEQWSGDANVHVRRLVSEGTRPRLPWAQRLPAFQKDPRPVVALLERLKDDSEEYVRRSVANNLNDIGKDNPEILLRTVRKWMRGASEERKRLVRHALRSLVKQGNPEALDILGFAGGAKVTLENGTLLPGRVGIGEKIRVSFQLRNRETRPVRVNVDFRIHFVKANGSSAAKVFKMKAIELSGRGTATFSKLVSLAEMTTRRHYAGVHVVDALVNGLVVPVGVFELVAGKKAKI